MFLRNQFKGVGMFNLLLVKKAAALQADKTQAIQNPNGSLKPKKQKDFQANREKSKEHLSLLKSGYWVETKIGKDGKAVKERQYADHGRPDKHSNPYDNTIDWKENGEPNWSGKINYYGDEIPEFKYFKITGELKSKQMKFGIQFGQAAYHRLLLFLSKLLI